MTREEYAQQTRERASEAHRMEGRAVDACMLTLGSIATTGVTAILSGASGLGVGPVIGLVIIPAIASIVFYWKWLGALREIRAFTIEMRERTAKLRSWRT